MYRISSYSKTTSRTTEFLNLTARSLLCCWLSDQNVKCYQSIASRYDESDLIHDLMEIQVRHSIFDSHMSMIVAVCEMDSKFQPGCAGSSCASGVRHDNYMCG